MAVTKNTVFVGVKGTVLALDRNTGAELWRKKLKGSDFVNLTLDGEQLIATAHGEVFCLDTASGATRWQANLPGLGLGIVTVVTALAPNTTAPVNRARMAADESAASSAFIPVG